MNRLQFLQTGEPAAQWPKATISLLFLSVGALLLAPLQMPAGYAWLRHTTSESAAQGVVGAWLARLGFMIFGLTVIWLVGQMAGQWPQTARRAHLAFGVLMVGAAVFSSRPWLQGLPYDPVEDWLHSFAATAMGFAYALGVALRWWHRAWEDKRRLADMAAVAASLLIPLAMALLPDWAGLLQRFMFAVAYVWYGMAVWEGAAVARPGFGAR